MKFTVPNRSLTKEDAVQNSSNATDANEDKNAVGVEQPAAGSDDAGSEDEFKVTIRKLELPVRPRGVLAE